MEFDVEDIRPARQAQVVKGMFYDRRVILVVDTGEARPIAIALMPHQAVSLGHDLVEEAPTGKVRGQRVEPQAVAEVRPPQSDRSSTSRGAAGPFR